MAHRRRQPHGFSLVEVVLAIGIFALGVTVILGLLSALTRQSAVSADALSALRLPDAACDELQRLVASGGLDALAGQTKPMAAPWPDTLTLVATRDGSQVQTLNYLPPPAEGQVREDQQYFLIEVCRFTQAPLAFDSSASVLALHVRASWPYRTPGSSVVTASAAREQVSYNLAIRR